MWSIKFILYSRLKSTINIKIYTWASSSASAAASSASFSSVVFSLTWVGKMFPFFLYSASLKLSTNAFYDNILDMGWYRCQNQYLLSACQHHQAKHPWPHPSCSTQSCHPCWNSPLAAPPSSWKEWSWSLHPEPQCHPPAPPSTCRPPPSYQSRQTSACHPPHRLSLLSACCPPAPA